MNFIFPYFPVNYIEQNWNVEGKIWSEDCPFPFKTFKSDIEIFYKSMIMK